MPVKKVKLFKHYILFVCYPQQRQIWGASLSQRTVVAYCICILCNSYKTYKCCCQLHFIDEETEKQRTEQLAQDHSATKWESHDLLSLGIIIVICFLLKSL